MATASTTTEEVREANIAIVNTDDASEVKATTELDNGIDNIGVASSDAKTTTEIAGDGVGGVTEAGPEKGAGANNAGTTVKEKEVAAAASNAIGGGGGNVRKSEEEKKSDPGDGDAYVVKVKPQYVLDQPSPVLRPPWQSTDGSGDTEKIDDGSNKKRRGQNKKRPRDARLADSEKMCLSVVRGEECTYGAESCRYSHDLKRFLAERPDDIGEVLDSGGCPHWRLKGFCDFGVMCRLGSCHINMATGENLRRSKDDGTAPSAATKKEGEGGDGGAEKASDDAAAGVKQVGSSSSAFGNTGGDVKNVLSREVAEMLRKNRYPFVRKRHNDKTGKEKGSKDDRNGLGAPVPMPSAGEKAADVTTPALPARERRKIIDFRNRVYVAPLTTVGNLPFRRVMKRFGADVTCGEMALADQLLRAKHSEWALLKRHPSEDVFGVQIAAGHADQFTRVAEILERECEVDFVDINLGCPIDLVCKRGAGASLMLREKKLRQSLEGMTSVLSCPVTIKIRTGWDETHPIAHDLVKHVQGWGIDGIGAIFIHGRSRLQRYSRLANWDYISRVASESGGQATSDNHPPIPVIGNGDIFTFTDYEEKVAREGVESTAMIARGALIKPWLPTEIKERRHWDISASERLDMLKEFVQYGLEHWGSDQQGLNNTRRFVLEWLSFLYRYVPVGLLEVLPQQMNQRPPNNLCGRSDLETLMLSKNCADWIKISEMLLGPVPADFQFKPKHKASAYT